MQYCAVDRIFPSSSSLGPTQHSPYCLVIPVSNKAQQVHGHFQEICSMSADRLAGSSVLDLTVLCCFDLTHVYWPAGGNVGGTNDFGSSGNTGQLGSNTGGGVGGTNDFGSSGNTGSLGSGGGGENPPRCTLTPSFTCHVSCSMCTASLLCAAYSTLAVKMQIATSSTAANRKS